VDLHRLLQLKRVGCGVGHFVHHCLDGHIHLGRAMHHGGILQHGDEVERRGGGAMVMDLVAVEERRQM
jgi:hypothetical protein